jgi:hypothetical protein
MHLGYPAVNGEYDLGYLCKNTHGKIDKWNIYKPVPGAPHGRDVLYPQQKSGWYIGKDGKCGLKVFTSNNLQAVADYVLSTPESNRWSYNPPKGTDDEPYRLLDFEKYKTNRIKPLYRITSYEGTLNDERIDLRLYYKYNMNDPSLFITDLEHNDESFENWYLGAIFVDSRTKKVLSASCNPNSLGRANDLDFSFGTSYDPMTIPLLTSAGGFDTQVEYIMIPILSYLKKPLSFKSSQVTGSDMFCDLPINNGRVLIYKLSEVGCYMDDNSTFYDEYVLYYNVLGHNKTNVAVSLGGYTVELWEFDPYYPNDTVNAHKVAELNYESSSYIPANTEAHEMRVGGSLEWGNHGNWSISYSTAYNQGYFFKLIGDNPSVFINYTSRRVSEKI